jgi:hypothetical protein
MADKLFKVKIRHPQGGIGGTHIKAFDLAHAKRISNRLFGTLGVTVEPAKEFNG